MRILACCFMFCLAVISGCSSGGSDSLTGAVDTIPPSNPTQFRAVVKAEDKIALSWAPATDNVGIKVYRLYDINNVLFRNVSTNSVQLTGLTPKTQYCFKVSAVDTSGNESNRIPVPDNPGWPSICANTGALDANGKDPTENWNKFARNGDYLSAQLKSLKKFDYGIFITRMQAADGPVCSTFWLYSDAPAPGAMPEISQLWRWNEFDFEFVPYTLATQNSYITMEGSFPNPTVNIYGAKIKNWDSFDTQTLVPRSVIWERGLLMTDDLVSSDMQHFYNKWMLGETNSKYYIDTVDFNFAGVKKRTGPPHQTGWTGTPVGKQPGWTFAADWKYPLTAISPVPSGLDIKKMAAINWWRMPKGNQSITVDLPGYAQQTYSHIMKKDVIGGSTAATSSLAAAMNNESYLFPVNSFSYNPYTSLNTYTIVWTKKRIAYYINAGNNGRDVANSTPVMVFDLANFPSMADSGTQADQGKITWVDTTLADQLGGVSINLANYVAFKKAKNYALKDPVNNIPACAASATCTTNDNLNEDQQAGAGWSGFPPGSAWNGADAYVRSVEYYPLSDANADGTLNTHFDYTSLNRWVFDLADGTWSATNFYQNISAYFGILYAQDYTRDDISITMKSNGVDVEKITGTLRDSVSPLAVSFVANADGSLAADKKPLMKLSSRPSDASPRRNFFRLSTNMDTGKAISDSNPFMYATIDSDGTGNAIVGVSGPSTPLSFFAPPAGTSVNATIKLYTSSTYKGSFPTAPAKENYSAVVKLQTAANGDISWSFVSGDAIVSTYQSANPHMITVKLPSQTGKASYAKLHDWVLQRKR